MTRWLCAYWPVRNVEREGQHNEYETKLLSNVTPWFARSARTLPITRIDSTVWSSVMTTTTFGRFTGAEAATSPADPAVAATTLTAAASGPAIANRFIATVDTQSA